MVGRDAASHLGACTPLPCCCFENVPRLLAQVKGLDVIPGLRRDLEASSREIERLTSQRDGLKVATIDAVHALEARNTWSRAAGSPSMQRTAGLLLFHNLFGLGTTAFTACTEAGKAGWVTAGPRHIRPDTFHTVCQRLLPLPQAKLEQTTRSLERTRSELEASMAECSSLQGRLTEARLTIQAR